MKKLSLAVWFFALLALILDSRCSSDAVRRALSLCMQTILPSLFPLFVCSAMLMPALSRLRFPKFLGRMLHLPRGTEGLFLLGSVGGFPLGARCFAQAVENRQLSREDAAGLLGICSNCGPAFLFGILPSVFSHPLAPMFCFLIQLECAMLIARFRRCAASCADVAPLEPVSLSQAVQSAMRAVGTVCAWILLVSVGSAFLGKWVLLQFPAPVRAASEGILELTSGCLALKAVPEDGLRFILCCGLLNFGGVSVLLQIRAVADGIPMGRCVLQKLCQAAAAVLLSAALVRFGPAALLMPVLCGCFRKKQWNFPSGCGIIPVKREVSDHAVS